ncbi:hypothetical protein PAHAL_7G157800 [Panicum hallii]|uniref:F-box domain-containing protein n=1 Tax=Panicum hallii TaxID=206008 RepID=A0A2T8ICH4_9POAL|nr:hypothetical protein PAHAL_7G157800 [Panicum hallii]
MEMEAAPKRARAGGGEAPDRFSALPDELLRRVLSFLPSRQAVQTTVLSERWIDLWRLMPAIDLNIREFKCRSPAPGQWPCIPTAYAAGTFTSRLRTLRLSGLSLTSNFADDLAAGFPVLEDMFDELVLMAPSLVSLRVLGDAPPITLQCLTPSVVEATLMYRAGDLGVLRSLRNARSLKLFGFSTTALLDDREPGGFPMFGNLRTLLLDGCDVGAGCHVLRRFLGSAPGLETLTLRSCLCNGAFSGGGAPTSRSGKRKASAKRKRPDDQRAPAAYPCTNLKLIELEFEEDHALFELAGALRDISKEVVRPIEGSVQDGRRTVKIKYT